MMPLLVNFTALETRWFNTWPVSYTHLDVYKRQILIFMTYVGMLETFPLNRADPIWVLFAMAVMGLGLAARMRAKAP